MTMYITSAMTVIRRRMTFGPLLLSSFLLASCGGGGGSSGTPPPVTTPPSDLQYPAAPTFVVDTAIAALTPTVVGEVTSYSVSPALPAGLSLNTTTGIISGTPTSVAAKADYMVTATNAGGSTTATVSVVVRAAAPAAPSDLQYPTPPTFVINTSITSLTPTVVGQVTSYSVTPALPAGLTLSTTTGVISGTPTSVAAKANYTVKAANAGGSTTAIVSIAVNGIAPSIAYSPDYSFTANIAAQTITPTVSGGAVVSWAISPALPAGLVFNTTNGTISGTPTVAAASSTYTVTATNSGGQSKAAMTLAIAAAPLLDLVHTNSIALIRTTGSAVLSLDTISSSGLLDFTGHWVLQNYASGATLASGDLPTCTSPLICTYATYPAVDLAGDTMIDPIPGGQYTGGTKVVSASSGVEIRSASTGKVLGTISGQFWWYQLASDGSYVVIAGQTSLTVYTPAGQMLFSVPGIFRTATAFSTPKAVQLTFLTCPGDPPHCPSPGAQNVIETIPVATGTPTASAPFQGQFYSWFADGARYLTTLGSKVFIYSSAGVQQDSKTLGVFSQLGGAQGPWFWTWGEGSTSSLNIYQVGASAAPAFSGNFGGPTIVASGPTLGVVPESGGLIVIDLSGPSPVSATYTPFNVFNNDFATAYAATSAAAWLVGDDQGVVFDGASIAGPPRFLAFGPAQSIAGGTEYFSVATASGQIYNFNSSTAAPAGTINLSSSLLSMSSDGTVLAAWSENPTNSSVNIYSLPAATLVNSFPYGSATGVNEISLSGSGTVLAQLPSNTPGCDAAAVAVTGGAPIWCDMTGSVNNVQLSPDGTLVAASTKPQSAPYPTTSIYKNGVLTTSVPGWVVGWLDNTRFLASNYQEEAAPPHNTVYLGNIIYSSQGSVLSTPMLPEISEIDVVSANAVYSPELNTIFSLTTSAPTWLSGNSSTGVGALSGSQIVFASENLVLAQPY
jgi:putative Ig domain-containing protein